MLIAYGSVGISYGGFRVNHLDLYGALGLDFFLYFLGDAIEFHAFAPLEALPCG
jgi:hypothetical protein